MSERSGVAAQIGVATEETYGTYKAPTRFLPFTNETLQLTKEYIRSKGLRAGRLVQAKTLHLATTKTVAGDINLEFLNQGMGIFLDKLTGSTVTPAKVTESETAYKATYPIGLVSPFGKSLCVQVGRPDTGGTVRPFSFLGCKVTGAKLSVARGGVTELMLTIDGRDGVTAESLGSASYSTTAVPFTFDHVIAKLAGSEVANVTQITFDITIPQNTGRFNLGSSGKKLEPIINDLIAVTASASMEFASLADYERFTKEEVVKLEAIATGAEIDAKASFKTAITASAAKQVNYSAPVQGPDILTAEVSFECLDNGTETPLSIETITTDSTI